MKSLLGFTLILWPTLALTADPKGSGSKVFEYQHGSTTLEGFVAYPKDFSPSKSKRPAVLVVHEWTGLGPFAKAQAQKLADLGYVAFAVDIYGKGIRPANPKDASETAAVYKNDRSLMRARILAAVAVIEKERGVDPKRIAAIGFCFGGTTVLELARSGANVRGVVSFHGGLSNPSPADAKKIKAKVLVLHGAVDPYVSAAELAAFEAEMNDAQVDYELIKYSGAVHSFTNPEAGNDPKKGAAYNERASRLSWDRMKAFLESVL
jgi:dienelactone hydrolase